MGKKKEIGFGKAASGAPFLRVFGASSCKQLRGCLEKLQFPLPLSKEHCRQPFQDSANFAFLNSACPIEQLRVANPLEGALAWRGPIRKPNFFDGDDRIDGRGLILGKGSCSLESLD